MRGLAWLVSVAAGCSADSANAIDAARVHGDASVLDAAVADSVVAADAPLVVDAPVALDASLALDSSITIDATADADIDADIANAPPLDAGPPVVDPDLVVEIYQTALASGSANCWTPIDTDFASQIGSAAPISSAWSTSGSHPANGHLLLTRTLEHTTGGWTNSLSGSSVAWSVVDPDHTGATVDDEGIVITGAPGVFHVVVQVDDRISDPSLATVTAVAVGSATAIRINPADDTAPTSLALGARPMYAPLGAATPAKVTAAFAGGSAYCMTYDATYATTDASVSSAAFGLANGTGVGSATISATFAGLTDSAAITVGSAEPTAIFVSPATSTIAAGSADALAAFALWSDDSMTTVAPGSATTWSVVSGPFAVTGSGTVTRAGAGSGATGEIECCIATTFVDAGGSAHANQPLCSNAADSSPLAPPAFDSPSPIDDDAVVTAQ